MSASCEKVRELHHAFRAGEVSPLERQRVEAHVRCCKSCAAELWLDEQLASAAKAGPLPLGDAKKRELLDGIHRRLASEPRREPMRLRLAMPRLAIGSFAFAAAAAAVLLLVGMPASEVVTPARQGWVARASGVSAYAPDAAQSHLTRDGAPLLRVERGLVLVDFQRQPGEPALTVSTPKGDVEVIGTLLFVDVSDDGLAVGVHHGRVRVALDDGRELEVGAGEKLSTKGGLSRQPTSGADKTLARQIFGAAAVAESESPVAAVSAPERRSVAAAPPSRPAPRLASLSTERRPVVEAPAAPDAIEQARQLWRDGDAPAALALLARVQRDAATQLPRREEALYLVATIERSRGRARAAVAALEELVAEDSGSRTASLARLELARLRAGAGQRGAALDELSALIAEGGPWTEEASFERCAVLIEAREEEEARRCLEAYGASFPNGAHTAEVAELLRRATRSDNLGR